MQPYDESNDLLVHLYKYEQHIEVLGVIKEVMCRCFSLFLIDLPTMWSTDWNLDRVVHGQV